MTDSADAPWGLLEAVPDATVVVGKDGRIQFANAQTLALFGYDRAELIGQPIETLVPERYRAAHPGKRGSYFGDPRQRPMGSGVELFGRRRDKSEFPAEISLGPFQSAEGPLVIAAVRDVTGRKKAQQRVLETEARYHAVLDNMLEAAQILSFDWRYLYLNDAAVRNARQPREEMLGRTVMERFPGIEATEMFSVLRKCMNDRTTRQAQFDFSYPDGTSAWFEFSIQPVPEGLFVLSLDITARKMADLQIRAVNAELERRVQARTAELEEANRFLDAIVENIPDAVYVKSAETLAYVRVNRAVEELTGFSRDQLIGKSVSDLFPSEEADFSKAGDRAALEGRTLVDIPDYQARAKGSARWLHTKKVPILDDAGTPRYLLTISEDVTERRQQTEARAQLAAIVESSDDAIISKTLDGVITSWNGAAERLFGYPAAEVIGQRMLQLIPADRRDEEAHILATLKRGERIEHFETVRRRKDGRELDVSVAISPLRTASGELVGASKIARDITRLKQIQRELVRANQSAEAANRELESFSYSVAHDLRAPLRSIDGFSQALLEDQSDRLDAEGKKHLGIVRTSAQLMAQLIDDILTLSRVSRSELARGAVDLSALARAALARLERAEPGRRVEVEIEGELAADGDARLLAVVLDNLLGNAWKFTARRQGARIQFGATAKDGQPAYFVRDNGAGFDMAYGSKLFGAFQRLHTSREFEGTGIGLATVQRVVHRHGGRVWAEGQVDAGATFYFTLGNRERST